MAEENKLLVVECAENAEKPEEAKEVKPINEKWLNEAEVESSMLADQSMPPYLNITEDPSPTKPEESKLQSQNSCSAASDVVCLGSSEDEREDNDDGDSSDDLIRDARTKQKIYNYHGKYKSSDEGEDDDTDNEDIDDEEEDDDVDEEEDRVDDEDEDIGEDSDDGKEDGQFSDDDDTEPEMFERSSVDYSRRTSNPDRSYEYKERSKSLEELSPRSKKFKNRREMYMNPLHSEMELNGRSFNHIQPSNNYNNDSNNFPREKPKNLSSAGRKLKEVLTAISKQADISMDPILENQESTLKLNPQSRQIKELKKQMSKAAEEEKLREKMEKEEIILDTPASPEISTEIKSSPAQPEQRVEEEAMEVDETTASMEKNSIKRSAREKLFAEISSTTKNLSNGQSDGGAILNIQSLSYEDYMKNNFTQNSAKTEQSSMENIVINYTRSDDMTNSSVDTLIIPPSVNSNELIDEPDFSEHNQLVLLSSELDLKTEQYNEIKKDYQEALADISQLRKNNNELNGMLGHYKDVEAANILLQNQVDHLRNELARFKEENKPKETKAAAVQTDKPKTMISSSTTTQLNNVKPAVSETDLHSTMSTIHDWTASEYSCPSVSILPPNVDDVLNADSVGQDPSKKSTRKTSRALLTTTRILQTLASITPRKSALNQSPSIFSSASRKRKASESVGSSLNAKQPHKVPTINTNDVHNQYNMTLDRESAAKTLNSLKNQGEMDGSASSQKNQLDNNENDPTDVKCYVWDDEEDGEERSCLIQATLPDDENASQKVSKEHARECGPYILGNLEVRLAEANGTLNIWGKDISQKSSKNSECQDNESMEEIPFNCSATKKVTKSPSSIRANITRQFQTMFNRSRSPTSENMENHAACSHFGSSSDLYHREDHCEKFHAPKRICSVATSRVKPSCCIHKSEMETQGCHCRSEQDTCRNPVPRYTCCDHSPAVDHYKHLSPCYHRTGHHDGGQKECSPYAKKPAHCCKQQTSREMTGCMHCSDEADEPMMYCAKPTETPDAKRHLRGKRVRNIVEFLKSCGDCRNMSTSNLESTKTAETEISNTQSLPSNRITPVPSSFSCPKQSHNFGYQNACDKTSRGPSENLNTSMGADCRASLESMRSEMTELRAKIDSLCNMLVNVLNNDSN